MGVSLLHECLTCIYLAPDLIPGCVCYDLAKVFYDSRPYQRLTTSLVTLLVD
jgi:hypothetical protein